MKQGDDRTIPMPRECANARKDEKRTARDGRMTVNAKASSRELTDLSYFRRNFQDFFKYSIDSGQNG